MSDVLCPECRSWRRAPRDRFCGRCGHSFMVIAVESVRPCVVYADQVGNAPLAVEIVLYNAGSVAVGGSQIVITDEARREVAPAETIAIGTMDEPGETVTLRTTIPSGLWRSGQRWRGAVTHRLPAGGKTRILSEIDVGRPRPLLSLAETDVRVDAQPAVQDTTVSLRLRQDNTDSVDIRSVAVVPYTPGDAVALPVPERNELSFSTEETELVLLLPRSVQTGLLSAPAGVRYRLSIDLVDHHTPYDLPFRMFIPRPAMPFIEAPERLAALAGEGRRGRLMIRLGNNGGEPYRVKRMVVEIGTGKEAVTLRNLDFAQDGEAPTVHPARAINLVLHMALANSEGRALPPGQYRAKLTIEFTQADLKPYERRFILDVRKPAPFAGEVFVDFGTVATAVAVSKAIGGRVGEAFVLPLGTSDRFLPTQITYVHNPLNGEMTVLIGEEARRVAEAGGDGDISCFENLKWHLTDREVLPLPDGASLTRLDIAARYLSMLRTQIEEHPDVAALVSEVYPTCPARFSTPDRDALFEAYRRAGFDPLRVADARNAWFELSESWAPAILTLRLPLLRRLQMEAASVDTELLAETGNAPYLVLTYDVGGGSTDMSLFRVQPGGDGPMMVIERATDGDTVFCGNGISIWLYEHLEPALHDALRCRGLTPTEVPIHPPWNTIRIQGVTPLAVRNGQAIAQLIRRLQHNEGPMLSARSRPFSPAGPDLGEGDHFAGKHQGNLEVIRYWEALAREVDGNSPFEGQFVLRAANGQEVALDWSPDDLQFAGAKAFSDFVTRFAEPLRERLERLVQRVGPADGERLYVLVTGRGARFPLVHSMVEAHVRALFRAHEILQIRVDEAHLKTITSHGASLLTHIFNASPESLSFSSDCAPILGVLGETDPATQSPRFLRLCRGFPTPADGFLKVARPFSANRRPRLATLALSRGEALVFDERQHEVLVTARATIELDEEQARRTHILVDAPAPNLLRLWIGHPLDGVEPGDPVTPETWRLIELSPHLELYATSAADADEGAS